MSNNLIIFYTSTNKQYEKKIFGEIQRHGFFFLSNSMNNAMQKLTNPEMFENIYLGNRCHVIWAIVAIMLLCIFDFPYCLCYIKPVLFAI